MRPVRVLGSAVLLSAIFVSTCPAQSMTLKPVYFFAAGTNKIGQASYWSIYLGNPPCSLDRKYPGEPMRRIATGIDLHLLSNGYVSGQGYSDKGRIDCSPVMKIKIDSTLRDIIVDSIDCIYDGGRKVRTTAGVTGEFVIDIEGNRVSPDQFTMTELKLTGDSTDKQLKRNGDDITVDALAFSKDGIAWALKTMAAEAKADSAKADAAKIDSTKGAAR